MASVLELSGLTRVFPTAQGEVRAVDDVSLTLNSGELFAVVGPSGCGKSTLLLCAGALLHPTSGSVRLAGVDPYALRGEQRARMRAESIGFVFQQFHLVPYLSVRENVLSPAMAAGDNGQQNVEATADELIERFGLTPRRDHLPAALSSGERQRTALARALLNRPRLLLADEPTGNLDGENTRIVLRHLREFADSGGAVLLVTHDEEAVACANKVLRLQDGRVMTDQELSAAQ